MSIEILIIVFAVTLSISLHSWSEHRHEQKEVAEFLRGLKDDLKKDIRLLKENKETITRVHNNFSFLDELSRSGKVDTAGDQLIFGHLYFEMRATHANIGRYEGFKSSGKLGFTGDENLKQKILEYYQQILPNLGDVEDVSNSLQDQILNIEMDKPDKEPARSLLKTFKMRALLQLAIANLEGTIHAYDESIKQAATITEMIERESPQL